MVIVLVNGKFITVSIGLLIGKNENTLYDVCVLVASQPQQLPTVWWFLDCYYYCEVQPKFD